jgi:glycosyltransferase involved in cell wall biosynthesis
VTRMRPDLVLFDSYLEYLAPLWIDPHIILSRIFGIRYAANLHDPVRSYVVGPKWWHRLSVWLAYQPLDFVLVHHELVDRSVVPNRVQVLVAPHGLYDMNLQDFDRWEVRKEWEVSLDQKVFLSFGYVRDGKNLDLAIRAIREVPNAFLVVAGTVASAKDKTFQDYKDLAADLAVSDRCLFIEGYLSDEELGKYFAGTDFVLLTYSSSFHSQSGVLNLAARARKPVLASASPCPMMESVTRFNLGIAVAPDSTQEITAGMKRLTQERIYPQWEDYEAQASWSTNAKIVLSNLS